VLEILKTHILNDLVWPDFGRIPSKDRPILTYRDIAEEIEFQAGDFRIMAFASSHSVPSVGYRIAHEGKTLVFSAIPAPQTASGTMWETPTP